MYYVYLSFVVLFSYDAIEPSNTILKYEHTSLTLIFHIYLIRINLRSIYSIFRSIYNLPVYSSSSRSVVVWSF